jgi:hypothetical protein
MWPKSLPRFGFDKSEEISAVPVTEQNAPEKTHATQETIDVTGDGHATADEKLDKEAQRGVQQVEAVTLSWTKPALAVVFGSYVNTESRVELTVD